MRAFGKVLEGQVTYSYLGEVDFECLLRFHLDPHLKFNDPGVLAKALLGTPDGDRNTAQA